MSVLDEVGAEMSRQVAKWGIQNHASYSDDIATDYPNVDAAWAKTVCDRKSQAGIVSWTDIFLEEVMEAVEEADVNDLEKLRTELVQCAAVAVSWIESIDRNKK